MELTPKTLKALLESFCLSVLSAPVFPQGLFSKSLLSALAWRMLLQPVAEVPGRPDCLSKSGAEGK
jgi:hypothetical protein